MTRLLTILGVLSAAPALAGGRALPVEDDGVAQATDEPASDTDAPDGEDEGEDEGDGEEDEEPPPLILLRPPDEEIPSALDEDGVDALGRRVYDQRRHLRSTAFFRPRIAMVSRLGDRPQLGVGLGATIGQRWWDLAPRFVTWGGENRLRLEGLAGNVGGFRFVGTSTVGPWIGRLGVRLGPQVEFSRVLAGSDELDTTLLVGGELTVAADLVRVSPWLGVATAWDVLGKREHAERLSLGTETSWIAGVAIPVSIFQVRVELRMRMTGIGPVGTGVIGGTLRLPPKLRDDVREGGRP